jgi:hypothetical protein
MGKKYLKFIAQYTPLQYCSGDQTERWVGHVVRMGKRRGLYKVKVGKSERKRPLGRPS